MDRIMMARALELALKGVGQVSPGPLVGCVIATPEGEILGEGFYIYEVVKHAETLAIEQAGERTRGAIAYVSLEPHAHHGRTPPCTDALISAGVNRVVAPVEDPNPKVSGTGFAHLRQAGVEVSTGLLAEEAEKANEKYFHFMRKGRPFVHLKLATSLDGKIATRTGDSRWITGGEARRRVHNLRHEYDAILIGCGTAVADDPLLTDRSGNPRRRPLVRIVLDEALQLPRTSKLATTANQIPLLLFTGNRIAASRLEEMKASGVEVLMNGTRNLSKILDELASRSIQSVLIEGGAGVAASWLEAGLVDKVTVFTAPMIIGGREAPNAIGGTGAAKIADAIRLKNVAVARHGQDLEITGYPSKAGESCGRASDEEENHE